MVDAAINFGIHLTELLHTLSGLVLGVCIGELIRPAVRSRLGMKV